MPEINRLTGSVDALTEEAEKLHEDINVLRKQLHGLAAEVRRKTVTHFVLLGLLFLLGALVAWAVIDVTLDNRRALDANNRRWCPVVEPLAPQPGDAPPAGTSEQQERSYRIRIAFGQLAQDFGCTTPPAAPPRPSPTSAAAPQSLPTLVYGGPRLP